MLGEDGTAEEFITDEDAAEEFVTEEDELKKAIIQRAEEAGLHNINNTQVRVTYCLHSRRVNYVIF